MQKETKDEVKETNKRGQKRRNKEAVMKENDVKSEAVHKRTNERRIKEEKGRKDVTWKKTREKWGRKETSDKGNNWCIGEWITE